MPPNMEPTTENLHHSFLHQAQMFKAKPADAMEAALAAGANIGVTTLKLNDEEIEAVFHKWLRKIRAEDPLLNPVGSGTA